jgi:ATP-dependent Clp protease ATP-binding subunit ClpB
MGEMTMSDLLEKITDKEKLLVLLANMERGESRRIDEAALKEALDARVKGQQHITGDLARLIRIQWGKERRDKPIASLLFLGPTGTGKSELAKAMAAYLFGDAKSVLDFDCGELTIPESKTRLIGVPRGYVGWESGGQLTRPMLNNPRRLVLFDEIEKAWSGIFDLFLSMLDGGRVTEQSTGKTANFTQSIVVLTGNAEEEAIGRIQEQVEDPDERADAIKKHLRESQVFRPEIIGRFDKIYVFKKLDGYTNAQIAANKLIKLAQDYRVAIDYVDPELIFSAVERGQKNSDFGARELGRVVDDIFAGELAKARDAGCTRVQLVVDAQGGLRFEPEACSNSQGVKKR